MYFIDLRLPVGALRERRHFAATTGTEFRINFHPFFRKLATRWRDCGGEYNRVVFKCALSFIAGCLSVMVGNICCEHCDTKAMVGVLCCEHCDTK